MMPKLKRLQVFLDEELITKLDEWRITNMPLKSRSKAIARLIEKGMEKGCFCPDEHSTS